jgi:hypothetical protein
MGSAELHLAPAAVSNCVLVWPAVPAAEPRQLSMLASIASSSAEGALGANRRPTKSSAQAGNRRQPGS